MTNVHESISKTQKPTLKEIDSKRVSNSAYNYLCHLEECKQWIEKMISKEYTDLKDFESKLSNGIDLCLLALKFAPESVKKIYYGKEEEKGNVKAKIRNITEKGLTTAVKDYRYTDNIHFFVSALRTIKLPEYFLFDTVSLYEGKNIPSVIYCLHALSLYLKYKGYTNTSIKTLYGMEFSSALIDEKNKELKERERNGLKIPEFKNIKNVMHKEFINDLVARVKYLCYMSQRKEKYEKEERARQMLEEQMHISEKNRARRTEEIRLVALKDKLFFHIYDTLSRRVDDTLTTALKTFLYKNVFEELIDKKRISVFTIKFYLFIFYDSNNEIRKENEIERIINDCHILRNENYEIEKYNDELEMRVNLLLNNKINASNISVIKPKLEDVMDTNFTYDTEDYNFIFNIMQTEPEWLCFLFDRLENSNEFVMTNVINLFTNERAEEKYLSILVKCAFNRLEKSASKMKSIADESDFSGDFNTLAFLNEQSIFTGIKTLMNAYFKGHNNNFKDALICNIKNLECFELENDPSKIYRNIFDVDRSREDALKNDTVSKIYLTRLKTLRGVIDGIIDLLFKHTDDISVCIRLFMQRIQKLEVSDHELLGVLFREFLYPFIIAPDAYSDFKVSPDTRDKLKMVVKGFECAITGESVYSLRPLERFFKDSKKRLIDFMALFTTCEEDYDYGYVFNAKPCVIFTGKQANSFTKTLRDIINLSPVKREQSLLDSSKIHDQSILIHSSVVSNKSTKKAIETELPFLSKISDILEHLALLPDTDKPINFYLNKPVAEDRAETERDLFIKRLKMKVIELLRIANGRNLLDIIIREATCEEEKSYQNRLLDLQNRAMEQEMSHSSSQSIMFLNAGSLYDIYFLDGQARYLTLNHFKESIYDDMQVLEEYKLVRRETHYNDMLCQLGEDILRVKYMSKERNRCLDIHKRNLSGLKERKEALRESMKNMERYLTSYIKTTFKNKGNLKDKNCEYGSFKVAGKKLKRKGVLIEMHRSSHDFVTDMNDCVKDLTFVFLCDEPGTFVVEIVMHMLVVNSFSFRFDELLKFRFRRMERFVIDGVCTFNVERLTELLNKHYIN